MTRFQGNTCGQGFSGGMVALALVVGVFLGGMLLSFVQNGEVSLFPWIINTTVEAEAVDVPTFPVIIEASSEEVMRHTLPDGTEVSLEWNLVGNYFSGIQVTALRDGQTASELLVNGRHLTMMGLTYNYVDWTWTDAHIKVKEA